MQSSMHRFDFIKLDEPQRAGPGRAGPSLAINQKQVQNLCHLRSVRSASVWNIYKNKKNIWRQQLSSARRDRLVRDHFIEHIWLLLGKSHCSFALFMETWFISKAALRHCVYAACVATNLVKLRVTRTACVYGVRNALESTPKSIKILGVVRAVATPTLLATEVRWN